MSKKKRTKVYKGSTAAQRPTVMRVSAVKRGRLHQWWVDHKRVARPVLIASGIGSVVVIVLIGIIDALV